MAGRKVDTEGLQIGEESRPNAGRISNDALLSGGAAARAAFLVQEARRNERRANPNGAQKGAPNGAARSATSRPTRPEPTMPSVVLRTSPCGAPLSTQLVRHEPRSRNSPDI